MIKKVPIIDASQAIDYFQERYREKLQKQKAKKGKWSVYFNKLTAGCCSEYGSYTGEDTYLLGLDVSKISMGKRLSKYLDWSPKTFVQFISTTDLQNFDGEMVVVNTGEVKTRREKYRTTTDVRGPWAICAKNEQGKCIGKFHSKKEAQNIIRELKQGRFVRVFSPCDNMHTKREYNFQEPFWYGVK